MKITTRDFPLALKFLRDAEAAYVAQDEERCAAACFMVAIALVVGGSLSFPAQKINP